MTGGTGAVSASRSGARLASSPEPSSGAGTALQSWPLQTRLSFAALPTAVSCARLHVRSIALEWGLQHLADTAELLCSELMTNAVQASQRMKIRADLPVVPVINLWVISDGISMVLHVWDASPEMPVRKDTAPDEESGYGLLLVETLSKDHGVYRKADGGKTVWCMITADP
jgi:anti-sigma regulatory factor (Ser/Thr protein kinase)